MTEVGAEIVNKERNYGIDLLRIVSMLAVCLLHILGQGGILAKTVKYSARYEIAWFLEITAYCAVNCYALISGYVGAGAKYKRSNLWYICVQTLFHCFWIFALSPLILPPKQCASLLFDVFVGKYYWYLFAYIGLFFLMPLLNIAVERLSKNELKYSLSSILGCIFVLSFFNNEIFGVASGYSVIWLTVLYVLGGYIRKYKPFKGIKSKYGVICIVGMLLVTWASKWGISVLGERFGRLAKYENGLVNYTSFTITGVAVILLELCSRLSFRKTPRGIRFISPLSFGCYIVHCNPVIFHHVLKGRLAFCTAYHPIVMAVAAVGAAIGLFLVCIALDYVRLLCFKWWKVRERLDALENKYKTVKDEKNGNED